MLSLSLLPVDTISSMNSDNSKMIDELSKNFTSCASASLIHYFTALSELQDSRLHLCRSLSLWLYVAVVHFVTCKRNVVFCHCCLLVLFARVFLSQNNVVQVRQSSLILSFIFQYSLATLTSTAFRHLSWESHIKVFLFQFSNNSVATMSLDVSRLALKSGFKPLPPLSTDAEVSLLVSTFQKAHKSYLKDAWLPRNPNPPETWKKFIARELTSLSKTHQRQIWLWLRLQLLLTASVWHLGEWRSSRLNLAFAAHHKRSRACQKPALRPPCGLLFIVQDNQRGVRKSPYSKELNKQIWFRNKIQTKKSLRHFSTSINQ